MFDSKLEPVGTLVGTLTIGSIHEPIILEEKTVQATKDEIIVTADEGYNGLSQVNVEGYALNNQEKTIQATKSNIEVEADEGYDGLSRVNILGYNVTNQEKQVQATKSDIEVTADNGYDGLSKVDILGYTLNNQEKTIQATKSDIEVTADNNYDGLSKVNVLGYNVNNQVKQVNPQIISQDVLPDQNYDGLSKVEISAVDNTIDNNIQQENIKKDVTILGVTGTYEGEICADLADWRNLFTTSYRKTTSWLQFCLRHSPSKIVNVNAVFSGVTFVPSEFDLSRFDWSECVNFKSAFGNCDVLVKIIFTGDKEKSFASLQGSGTDGGFKSSFDGCDNLEEVINFPIHYVGNGGGLTSTKKQSYDLPTFYNCPKLKKITFPQGCVPASDKNADYTLTILYFSQAVTEAGLIEMLSTLGQNTTGKKREFKLHANVFPNISQETKDAFVAKGYTLVE